MIPEGWEVKTVGELFNVQLGKMLNKEAAEKFPQYQYLGNSNVKWGCFNLSDLKTMHFSKKDREKFTLKSGDIVLCEGGEVGRCAIWRDDMEIYYQKALHRLRGNGGIFPDFFQLYMEKIAGTKLLDNFTTRTSIAHLTREKLVQLPVKLPPLSEQKKIAQILSTWDKAITTTEQLLANSQQQKKALMQQLLTGKKRFGFEDNSFKFKEVRYGKIPSDWGFPAIKEICEQVSGKNADQSNYPVLSCSKHEGFVDSLKYFKKKVYSDDTSGYRIIPRGCFGFPSNHIEEGSIGLQNLYEVGIVSPIYIIFKANQLKINNKYLFAILKTDHYRQIFSASTNASVDRRGSLRWDDFSSIHVPLPSLEEQNKIVSVLSAADREIEVLQQKLEGLKQEKKALIQQLLTGKRRVKV
jgi:type I restriction enzyme S subunit